MTPTIDFEKPMETAKSLMAIQTEAFTKTFELQKKSGEEMVSFFKTESEKAKELKTPEDIIKYNIEANKAFFALLKTQGEAFGEIATSVRDAAVAEVEKLAK